MFVNSITAYKIPAKSANFANRTISFGNQEGKIHEKDQTFKFLEMNLSMFGKVNDEDCYRGSAAAVVNYLEELKKLGVKNFICLYWEDLNKNKTKCDASGLNFISCNIPYPADVNPKDPESAKKVAKDIVKLFEAMNEGTFFIGCNFGQERTATALKMSKLMNPNDRQKEYPERQRYFDEIISEMDFFRYYRIYQCLSDEDKKRLGYTKEFADNLEEKFHKSIYCR